MTNQQCKYFINEIFEQIKRSNTIADIESIADRMNIEEKNRMNVKSYPKIDFSINQNEIRLLKEQQIINNNLDFAEDITSKISDPLTKLLYATAWKNGDLKKVKHIIRGIEDSDNENSEQDEALVFYQFGKYLTKVPGQPIIDQHVIRAYAIYRSNEISEIDGLREISILNEKHKSIIKDYKNWLVSDNISQALRTEKDYSYHIDKLLFATGKATKTRREKKSKRD